MKKNKVLLGAFLVVSGLILAACGSSNASTPKGQEQTVKDKGTLTVALSPDYPPFEFQMIKDGKNEIVGSDIDLANAIGKKLGVKVKISPMDFNNVLASLTTGKADLAISGISEQPDRKKSYDFSDVYYSAENYIVVKKSDVNKYKTLADFDGKKIATQKGSIQENIAKTSMAKSVEIALPTIGDEVNEIKGGMVQGAIVEDLIAKAYVSANPDLAILPVTVPNPKDNYGYAIAMPKGSDMKNTVNEVLKSLKDSGALEKSIQSNYKLSQTVK